MSSLQAEVCRRDELCDRTRQGMYSLYRGYYEGTDAQLFASDLNDKDQVLLLWDAERVLRGFSTLKVLEADFGNEPLRAIYSGDTIIHHRYWGEQSLAFTWIRLAGRIKAQDPETPLYWFLIVKGHRTYRYLQAFAQRYYPHWRFATPSNKKSIMDSLALERFGRFYRPDTGIVHFPKSRGHLAAEWATTEDAGTRRPEVQFFLERNPGYTCGDELVCLTELHSTNLRPLARRIFLQGFST
ncbi:MAG: hypothetical protein U9R74_11690 [Pseudomonadota bacterium]|nr:hypothetical protein [Pseudomonadota bacterium]